MADDHNDDISLIMSAILGDRIFCSYFSFEIF